MDFYKIDKKATLFSMVNNSARILHKFLALL